MTWYTNDPIFDTVLAIGLALAPITLLASLFMKAPYGRFGEKVSGLSPKLGWFLMELPAMTPSGSLTKPSLSTIRLPL